MGIELNYEMAVHPGWRFDDNEAALSLRIVIEDSQSDE